MGKKRLAHLLIIWTVYVASILAIAEIFENDHRILKPNDSQNKFRNGFFQDDEHLPAMARWDSVWYYALARDGYWGTTDKSKYTAAFYPLYSAAMRFTHEVTGLSLLAAGIFISALFLLGFLIIFEIYMKRIWKRNDQEANAAHLLFLLFPATFICLSVYHSSLFIFLVAGSLLALRLNKIKWAMAASLFAGLTHMHSLALFGALLVYAIQTRKKRDFLPAAALSLGVLVLFAHHYFYFGNALYYIEAKKWFSGEFRNPIGIVQDLWYSAQRPFRNPQIYSLIVFTTMATYVASLVSSGIIFRKENKTWRPELTLILMLCAIQITTASAWGFTRFALSLFPLFAWWGAWLATRTTAFYSVIICFGFLQMVHLLHWITWMSPAP